MQLGWPSASPTAKPGAQLMSDKSDPVAEKIREHGWAVVNVEGDDASPPFSYSVGLHETFFHPEVIVFGLPLATLQQILNAIGTAIRRGERFSEGDTTDRVLDGYPCAFRRVAPAAEAAYMGMVLDYYGSAIPAIHCIWPDGEGRFPWEHGTSADFRRLQPMLS